MYTGDVKPVLSVSTDTQLPDTSGPDPSAPHNLDSEPGTAVEVLELGNGETIWCVPLLEHKD